jgi:hypothetical protein
VTVTSRGLLLVAERPFTVRMLFSPAVIDVGLKLQVAPEAEQESPMLLVKELGADAETVNVV